MPVQKFRTFEEARQAMWLSPQDPTLLARMQSLARSAGSRRSVRRGVTRFRTIEDAKRDKERPA